MFSRFPWPRSRHGAANPVALYAAAVLLVHKLGAGPTTLAVSAADPSTPPPPSSLPQGAFVRVPPTMEAYPDPAHMNPTCPCFDPQSIDLLLTSTRLFSSQENSNLISGAKQAAQDHNVQIQFYQDTSLDGTGLANALLDVSRNEFHGTIITDFPHPALPSTGAIQVALNNFPNVTVVPVMSGETYIGSAKNLLSYVGPNNTLSGLLAAQRVLRPNTSSNMIVCVNPFQGISAKFDDICAGATAGVPAGSGSVEVFSAMNLDRIDTSQGILLQRIKQTPYPTAILAPESTISDLLFGPGSNDLVAAIQAANVSVVAVGICQSAIDGMKRGVVSAIIDNGEYLQGYLAVVQAYIFRQQNARLNNDVIWTGPTLFARDDLAAAGQLNAFYAHAAAHIAGYKPAGLSAAGSGAEPPSYTFTIATHASASSGFWANLRSGYYWSGRNTNSTMIEMVTQNTDAAAQAQFIHNVTNSSDPVRTAGWTVTLSRYVAFLPELTVADQQNVPIVVINTWGVMNITNPALPRVLAFVSSDSNASMSQLSANLHARNPGATQLICVNQNSPMPENGDCYMAMVYANAKGLNFTYLNLPSNTLQAQQITDAALTPFSPTTKMVVIDRTGNCAILDSLRKANFKMGNNQQVIAGSYDTNTCVVQAVRSGELAVSVLQQAFLQGYLPAAIHRVYQITGGYPFGHKLVKDPRTIGMWPYLRTGPFFADATVLGEQYINCTNAVASSTIPINTGPTDTRDFPYAQIAWPVCALRPRPMLTVPVSTISWSSPHAAAVAAVAALLTALILATFVIIIVKANHAIVKAMSPAFVAVILVGMLALELSALGWIGEFTAWKCHVETFVLPIAFSLLMGALFIKNYRLYKIFNNPYLMKSGLSNLELGLSVIAVVAPNLIVAIVWTIISPKQPKLTFVSLSSGQQSSYYLCASDSPKTDIIFLAVFYAYNIALVAATVWIAVVTRNVKAQLSESVYIGYSLYNAVATCIILIPLLFVGIITDFMVLFWFRAVILLYPVAFGFGMLFGKRVLYDTWLSEDQLNAAKSSKTPSILGSALRSASAVKESLTQSTLTCTVSILYQTGVMASWKRRTATYQVDTGMLALIEEPNQATGQFINMLHFALVRESNDPAVGHFSLAFAQLKTPLASASRTAAGAPPLPPNAPEKLVIDFESAAAFEAWAKHLRTGGAPKP